MSVKGLKLKHRKTLKPEGKNNIVFHENQGKERENKKKRKKGEWVTKATLKGKWVAGATPNLLMQHAPMYNKDDAMMVPTISKHDIDRSSYNLCVA